MATEYEVEILVDAYAVYPVTVKAEDMESAMQVAARLDLGKLPEPDVREFSETHYSVTDPETGEKVLFT